MISFFNNGGGSGEIRGRQIANYLKAKLSPKSGYENDVCIYVKCVPPTPYPKKTYIDVLEDSMGLRWVRQHPTVGIIASSKSIYEHLRNTLPNKIVLIPQHHCNFKREVRSKTKIDTVGIIGNEAAFQSSLVNLRRSLDAMGMKLNTLIKKKFKDREEVVEFYKGIDIQLIWRPGSDGVIRNPLKLVNAMSFGVLTVAYPEKCFDAELKGYYSDVKTMEEMLLEIIRIKRSTVGYDKCANALIEKAEEYHIDNISKLYLKLE